MLKLHKLIENNGAFLLIGTLVVSSIGGLVQVLPTIFTQADTVAENIKPYSPLRLAGRDVYIKEGCVACHSQQIRPLIAEVKRYGQPYEQAAYRYERPFLWGSERTGPDLSRVGTKYSDLWHELHFNNPRSVVPRSNMPSYPWLAKNKISAAEVQQNMRTLALVGHPYTEQEINDATQTLENKTELDAIIAYIQGLGVGIGTDNEPH